MSKTNKELAIDVAIATINSNPRTAYGINNMHIYDGLNSKSICNIIESVYSTLDKIDSNKE